MASNVAIVAMEQNYTKVVPFDVIQGRFQNKDDSINVVSRTVGKSSEVYAFRTKEEITAMLEVFEKHIAESTNDDQRKIACRNKLLFLVGMNIGIRGSDLRSLKWSFFFDEQKDGTLEFKKFYVLQPMKQRKQKKFVKLYFNKAVKTAINNYVSEYPMGNLNEYLFSSRKGEEPIEVKSLWRIIKDAAVEAGIKQNIGSHSLRKTFGYWVWHEAEDKNKALVILQQIFNHSNLQVTSKYIGILDDEIEDMFNSIELGLDMM